MKISILHLGNIFTQKCISVIGNNYDENIKKLIDKIKIIKKVIEPFVLLSLTDDLKLQKKNSYIYKIAKFSSQNDKKNFKKKNKKEKN